MEKDNSVESTTVERRKVRSTDKYTRLQRFDLHLDILFVFWIIALVVLNSFGFAFGTVEFGTGMFLAVVGWLIFAAYHFNVRRIEERRDRRNN